MDALQTTYGTWKHLPAELLEYLPAAAADAYSNAVFPHMRKINAGHYLAIVAERGYEIQRDGSMWKIQEYNNNGYATAFMMYVDSFQQCQDFILDMRRQLQRHIQTLRTGTVVRITDVIETPNGNTFLPNEQYTLTQDVTPDMTFVRIVGGDYVPVFYLEATVSKSHLDVTEPDFAPDVNRTLVETELGGVERFAFDALGNISLWQHGNEETVIKPYVAPERWERLMAAISVAGQRGWLDNRGTTLRIDYNLVITKSIDNRQMDVDYARVMRQHARDADVAAQYETSRAPAGFTWKARRNGVALYQSAYLGQVLHYVTLGIQFDSRYPDEFNVWDTLLSGDQ